jgi:FkbM family methyltransferase
MVPGLAARAFRWFALLPHFKGKSRLEALVEPFIPMPVGAPVLDFPSGFSMKLRMGSLYERGLYFHDCEPDTAALLRRLLRPGDRFLDCGANLGFYTLLAATLVGPSGHVDAVEPTPATYGRLGDNVALNRLGNVTTHQLALGATMGRASVFGLSDDNHGMNLVAPANSEGALVGTCDVETIDGLVERGVIPRPAVMKIDVEGSELALLRGAEQLLRNAPPVIVIELSRFTARRFGHTPEDIVAYVRSLGDFVIEYPALGRIQPVSVGSTLPHYRQVGTDAAANYIFRPRGADGDARVGVVS